MKSQNTETEKHTAQHSYQLIVYDREKLSETELLLAEKGQDLQNLSYKEPVLFQTDSRIRLHIDHEEKEYILPESLTEPLELLAFTIGKQDGSDVLLVRRYEHPDHVYTIRLEEEFEADIQTVLRDVKKATDAHKELSAYRTELERIQAAVQENGYVNTEDFTKKLREMNQQADALITQYDSFLKAVSQEVIDLQKKIEIRRKAGGEK